ncbi:hypothetical protein DL96DRAFT_1562479 [Flagelloscypha sp. PMI_526]|nr:hypothetical protein DL96DRAFT_1562479 [Flagelloscypha sp. PMI_526]
MYRIVAPRFMKTQSGKYSPLPTIRPLTLVKEVCREAAELLMHGKVGELEFMVVTRRIDVARETAFLVARCSTNTLVVVVSAELKPVLLLRERRRNVPRSKHLGLVSPALRELRTLSEEFTHRKANSGSFKPMNTEDYPGDENGEGKTNKEGKLEGESGVKSLGSLLSLAVSSGIIQVKRAMQSGVQRAMPASTLCHVNITVTGKKFHTGQVWSSPSRQICHRPLPHSNTLPMTLESVFEAFKQRIVGASCKVYDEAESTEHPPRPIGVRNDSLFSDDQPRTPSSS